MRGSPFLGVLFGGFPHLGKLVLITVYLVFSLGKVGEKAVFLLGNLIRGAPCERRGKLLLGLFGTRRGDLALERGILLTRLDILL